MAYLLCGKCNGAGWRESLDYACSSCERTGLVPRPETMFPMTTHTIPVEYVGLCEGCGQRSNERVCCGYEDLHDQQKLGTELAQRGHTLWLRTHFYHDPKGWTEVQSRAVGTLKRTLGSTMTVIIPIDSAQDLIAHFRENIDKSNMPKEARLGLEHMERMVRTAILVQQGGMPWWMALIEASNLNPLAKQYASVNGNISRDTESPCLLQSLKRYRKIIWSPHQWLLTAWRYGVKTRYAMNDYAELVRVENEGDDGK